jgi:hypothetical protein
MPEVKVKESYVEFLDEMVKQKDEIDNRQEAIEHCIEQEAQLYI